MTADTNRYTIAPWRAVVAVDGADATGFLQGLATNDVARVSPDNSVWAALLSPQGRLLHEFFICRRGGMFLLDTGADGLDDLRRRLTMYRLRAKVDFPELPDNPVVALLWGPTVAAAPGIEDPRPGLTVPFGDGLVFVDPRLPALGLRAILPRAGATETLDAAGLVPDSAEGWERHRLALGVPEGARDLPPGEALPMENGLEKLNALDWEKGCYVGQELTARMRYRGLAKKRLVPVTVEGAAPPPGTPVTGPDGREAGIMRSAAGGRGLCLLRVAALEAGGELRAGAALISPQAGD